MKKLPCVLLLLSAATFSLGTEVNRTFDQGLTDYGDNVNKSCPIDEICDVKANWPDCRCLRILKQNKCPKDYRKGDPRKEPKYYKKQCCKGKGKPESCCLYLSRKIDKKCGGNKLKLLN